MSLSALPALKVGTLEAAILISAPVAGLRPMRSARVLTSKEPKPTSWTFSPSLRDAAMASKAAVTTASAWKRRPFQRQQQ